MSPLVRPAQDLNWLITNFVERVPAVAHAIVVSADGLPMAFSQGFPTDRVDQLAAVTSGLTSLTQGAARIFEGGPVTQTIVEMKRGFLFVMSISDGSSETDYSRGASEIHAQDVGEVTAAAAGVPISNATGD